MRSVGPEVAALLDWLRDLAERGEPGGRLPYGRSSALDKCVGRVTVRRVLCELGREGLAPSCSRSRSRIAERLRAAG